MDNEPDSGPRPPRARRKRYRGTHPRQFQERYKELAPERYPDLVEHVRAQGRTPAGAHVPVLREALLAELKPAAGEVVLDCTLGYGGHALELLRHIGPSGRLIGLDVDAVELERTQRRLEEAAQREPLAPFVVRRSNFAGAPKVLAREDVAACDIVLADLGVSSMQIDNPERGFSFKSDGPLDMRMDARIQRSAADWLRDVSVDRLAQALADWGDVQDARALAEAIVVRRAQAPFERTRDLARFVETWSAAHPHDHESDAGVAVARVFQALRILVNDEMRALAELLRVAPTLLKPRGRLAIISFHSGEDRLVKRAFREGFQAGVFEHISDEPIRPTPAEIRDNPRAASARLRVAIRESA